MKPIEVKVVSQKPSQFRKGIYYTVVDYFGSEAKVVTTRRYASGDTIYVRNVGAIADGLRLEQVKFK